MARSVDGYLGAGPGECACELEPRSRRIQTSAERRKPVHAVEQKVDRVLASLGASDSTVRGDGERDHALPSRDASDAVERGRRSCGRIGMPLLDTRLHELREQRSG